jgi:hypothetical protein
MIYCITCLVSPAESEILIKPISMEKLRLAILSLWRTKLQDWMATLQEISVNLGI